MTKLLQSYIHYYLVFNWQISQPRDQKTSLQQHKKTVYRQMPLKPDQDKVQHLKNKPKKIFESVWLHHNAANHSWENFKYWKFHVISNQLNILLVLWKIKTHLLHWNQITDTNLSKDTWLKASNIKNSLNLIFQILLKFN